MNILIIATGGTIGSSFDGESINVRADGRSEVIDRYLSARPDVQFDIRQPLNILSERVTCEDFNTLAKSLYEADFPRYDGVILTLGSDSLAYIASFVGLLFGERDIPIMLVAANKILSAPDSNGYENFCCAVDLIEQKATGVYVPYRNSDGVMYVHSATDIRQADLSEDFFSLHGAYATYDGKLNPLRNPIAHTVPKVFSSENRRGYPMTSCCCTHIHYRTIPLSAHAAKKQSSTPSTTARPSTARARLFFLIP